MWVGMSFTWVRCGIRTQSSPPLGPRWSARGNPTTSGWTGTGVGLLEFASPVLRTKGQDLGFSVSRLARRGRSVSERFAIIEDVARAEQWSDLSICTRTLTELAEAELAIKTRASGGGMSHLPLYDALAALGASTRMVPNPRSGVSALEPSGDPALFQPKSSLRKKTRSNPCSRPRPTSTYPSLG
jgi:hypothetical protein